MIFETVKKTKEEMGMKFIEKNKVIIGTALLAIIVIFSSYLLKRIKDTEKADPTIISESTLIEAIDISELSTAKYKYKGIAENYKNDKKTKIQCYIYYEAEVKAGIDMGQVHFDIDHENKIVLPSLPEIKITVNTIDEKTLDFMPEKIDVELKTILSECKKDAEREASRSTELLNTAEENLQSIIEALTYPLLKQDGYRIVWEDTIDKE